MLYLTCYLTLDDVKKWWNNLIEFTDKPDIRIIDLILENDFPTINKMLLNICNKEESINSFKAFIEFLKNQQFDTEEKIRKIIKNLLEIRFPYIGDHIDSSIDFIDQLFDDTIAEVFTYQYIFNLLPEWFKDIEEDYF